MCHVEQNFKFQPMTCLLNYTTFYQFTCPICKCDTNIFDLFLPNNIKLKAEINFEKLCNFPEDEFEL